MFENIEIYYCDVKVIIINNVLIFKYLNNIKCDLFYYSNIEYDFLKLNFNYEYV